MSSSATKRGKERMIRTFGCVADTKPSGYLELNELIVRPGDGCFGTFDVTVTACQNVVTMFRTIHPRGYCLHDVRDGTFVFNPQTGDVLICGHDSIGPNGASDVTIAASRFMAPELNSVASIGTGFDGGQRRITPSAATDSWTLAVLLFMVLCAGHPLEGSLMLEQRLAPDAERRLYGASATFVFDADDETNRPDPIAQADIIAQWNRLPANVQVMFQKSLGRQAVIDPGTRPHEADWELALMLLGGEKKQFLTPEVITLQPQEPKTKEERLEKRPRDILPIIYVIETSESIGQSYIQAVNNAMQRVFDAMRDAERNDTAVEVAVLSFSTDVSWKTVDEAGSPVLVDVENIVWNDLNAEGRCNLGNALATIDKEIGDISLFSGDADCQSTVIVFVSTGWPTDDWHSALKKLQGNNRLFRNAAKVCLAVGQDANMNVLAQVAGTARGRSKAEAVIAIDDVESLEGAVMAISLAAIAAGTAGRGRRTFQNRMLDEFWGENGGGFGPVKTSGFDYIVEPVLIKEHCVSGAMSEDVGVSEQFMNICSDTSADSVTPSTTLPTSSGSTYGSLREDSVVWAYSKTELASTPPQHKEKTGSLKSVSTRLRSFLKERVGSGSHKAIEADKVLFSVAAPKSVKRNDYTTIHMAMYERECREYVEQLKSQVIQTAGEVNEFQSGLLSVREGATVRVILESKEIWLGEGEREGTWLGEFLSFSFNVFIPADYDHDSIPFAARVYFDNIPLTRLDFTVSCSSRSEQWIEVVRHDVHSAFMSYAHEDREGVMRIQQGMKAARPDLDVFVDVLNLRAGERWEPRITEEVEKRDILYLCWSRYARESEYVDFEWRHALKTKGIDAIEPIPFESPQVCPPPAELKELHFNDALLWMIGTQ